MLISILIFFGALALLLFSANLFTNAAEKIGQFLKLPAFVIGIFIVGIGTSLPELVSGIISVNQGSSEIVPGNIMGANISNILLVTGLAVVLNRKSIQLSSTYIYIDLHFLIGSFFVFYMIAYDGKILLQESIIGILIFVIYAVYLIRDGKMEFKDNSTGKSQVPYTSFLIIILTALGIYFGANYTIESITDIAVELSVPKSIIALTVLSLGTTLPELAVNISAIKKGKAEMAIGNVLGSCIFNTLMIPAVANLGGIIEVPDNLLKFSLPVMAACGILFYLLTQDKRISTWEGLLFVMIYILFIIKIIGLPG